MINRYGVSEQVSANSHIDVHVERIRMIGYTVIDSALPDERIEYWRSRLEAMADEQCVEAGGRLVLANIGEADTVRAPLARDPSFLNIATEEAVLDIVRRLLGDYFILTQQNGIINRPNADPHHQSSYHRDLPYQHFVSSRPIAINALLCLDPFEAETGSTVVLPASHKVEAFPSDDYIRQFEEPTAAKPGSYIILDSMLYHRAGQNRSSQLRRAVNNVYALPIIKQQLVLPAILEGRWRDDPFLARFLGYESDPPRNIREYHMHRIGRTSTKTIG